LSLIGFLSWVEFNYMNPISGKLVRVGIGEA
jgi:hypothetical protein